MKILSNKLISLVRRPRTEDVSPGVTKAARAMLELVLPLGWPESDAQIHWLIRNATGVSEGRVTGLGELPAEAKSARVHVWLPAAETLLTSTDLPTRNRAKIAQALPYALEDHLLGDPETLHFAYCQQDDGGLAVAVIERKRLKTCLDALVAAGLRPASVAPVTLAVPLIEEVWSVAFADNAIWVRTGTYTGFSCLATADAPPTMLLAALQEARRQQKAPVKLAVFDSPTDFNGKAWINALELPVFFSEENFWTERNAAITTLNLLQGEFAPTGQFRAGIKPLRPAAVILAVWLIVGAGFNLWEWWQLNRTHRTYQQEMTKLFRQTFPNTKVVLDAALQMQRNLEALQARTGNSGASDLLPMLVLSAPSLRANNKVKLRTLKYAGGNLTLDLSLPDFQTLEIIKNRLQTTTDLTVEVIGANRRASGVEGRLRILPKTRAAAKKRS